MKYTEREAVVTASNDTQLWRAVCSGDHAAWRELVLRYKNLVYSVCTHVGLSQAESADVFQDTWLQLYSNRRSIQDPSRLSSWLITTARRESVRVRKRSARFVDDERQTDTIDSVPLPDAQYESLEQQACLEIALDEIGQPCKRILHLFFFAPEEQSYDDIAKALGYSPNTLGAKRRRCLDRLRSILIGMGYLE